MAIDVSRIRALCFDVDGTLRDTDDQIVMALARLLSPLRVLLPGKRVDRLARWAIMAGEDPGTFLHGLPDRFNIDQYLARISESLRKQNGRKTQEFLIIQGVQDMLALLHRRYPLAIISARSEHGTLAFLESYALTPYFRCIATSQTCQHTKPFPDPILWAADCMGISPADCLMIGDTTVDMRAGKAAGAQTIGVLCGFGEQAELLKAGADHIISSTPDLLDLLGSAPIGRISPKNR